MKHSTKIALYAAAGSSVGVCISQIIRNGLTLGDVPGYLISFLLYFAAAYPCCWLYLRWREKRKK